MVGGPSYSRTVQLTQAHVRGNGELTMKERREVKKEMRTDSVQDAMLEEWCTSYLQALICTAPDTGERQVDSTNGSKLAQYWLLILKLLISFYSFCKYCSIYCLCRI